MYEEHIPGHWYDRALRDPWVIKDPESKGWLMFFTARVPDRCEANEGGAIGLATSDDLTHWQLQPPVFTGYFGQLEVPQDFEYGERWSQRYTESTAQHPVGGTHYLITSHPRAPGQWRPALSLTVITQ
ncbi:MAG: hypothetical protein ABJ000_08955 [Saccharospirillum sp.]|uniref:hypothetical protein n=1 Tax=Saccharospirillum sp. TaxID=2033801 RepID=UPI003298B5F9